eukprot:3410036-Rhodomonas_salina.3
MSGWSEPFWYCAERVVERHVPPPPNQRLAYAVPVQFVRRLWFLVFDFVVERGEPMLRHIWALQWCACCAVRTGIPVHVQKCA